MKYKYKSSQRNFQKSLKSSLPGQQCGAPSHVGHSHALVQWHQSHLQAKVIVKWHIEVCRHDGLCDRAALHEGPETIKWCNRIVTWHFEVCKHDGLCDGIISEGNTQIVHGDDHLSAMALVLSTSMIKAEGDMIR
jgi:hypothetical protein